MFQSSCRFAFLSTLCLSNQTINLSLVELSWDTETNAEFYSRVKCHQNHAYNLELYSFKLGTFFLRDSVYFDDDKRCEILRTRVINSPWLLVLNLLMRPISRLRSSPALVAALWELIAVALAIEILLSEPWWDGERTTLRLLYAGAT